MVHSKVVSESLQIWTHSSHTASAAARWNTSSYIKDRKPEWSFLHSAHPAPNQPDQSIPVKWRRHLEIIAVYFLKQSFFYNPLKTTKENSFDFSINNMTFNLQTQKCSSLIGCSEPGTLMEISKLLLNHLTHLHNLK